MISFFVVLFFSITGITLNHAELFQSSVINNTTSGSIDSTWTNSPDSLTIDKLRISEYFRNKLHAQGAINDFHIDLHQISFAFKGPGYEASVIINRKNGKYQFDETSYGLIGMLNDLHKGRDTGSAWAWFIDISAIFLILVSISGITLLFFLKKKKIPGIVVAILGLALMYVIYHYWGT